MGYGILCGHICAQGGMLEIGDTGCELGVTMDIKFYFMVARLHIYWATYLLKVPRSLFCIPCSVRFD